MDTFEYIGVRLRGIPLPEGGHTYEASWDYADLPVTVTGPLIKLFDRLGQDGWEYISSDLPLNSGLLVFKRRNLVFTR